MTRAELLALAARVETEEPSRELQIAVLAAFGWETLGDDSEVFARRNSVDHWQWSIAPDPLHSLDAAASLTGMHPWAIRYIDGAAVAWVRGEPGSNAIPAAALTAAALRARALDGSHD
jgi:hypothetical protein